MLKALKAHHRNIVQMSFNGFSANEIAERLDISTMTVTSVLRSPLGKAYIEGMTDKMKDATLDVRKELISMNKDALNTFKRLLDPKQKIPASVQFNTAKDVLDRSGFKAPDKLNIDMTFQTKSDEEIEAEIEALENSINKSTQATKEPTIKGISTIENTPTIKDTSIIKDSTTCENIPVSEDTQATQLPAFEDVLESSSEVIQTDEECQAILENPSFDPFSNIGEVTND